MTVNAAKTWKIESGTAAYRVSQQPTHCRSAFRIKDNRPETVFQRNLQKMADGHRPANLLSTGFNRQNVIQARFRGGARAPGNEIIVYNRHGDPCGRLIAGAQFDLSNRTSRAPIRKGFHKTRRIVAMNLGDYIHTAPRAHNRKYVRTADIQNAGGMTYTDEKTLADQRAAATTGRLKAGRTGAELGISGTPAFAMADYRRTLACYNFAVGSFHNRAEERQLQVSVPEYVSHRYGAIHGAVRSRVQARAAMASGPISAGRAAAIDALMLAAGMDITAGHINPDWYGGGGAALRTALKMPLQRFILRESGLRPNPDGKWAVGFRGQPAELGSDHAWLKAIDPAHPNRYITFDTFPASPRVQANRKRHADPYLPRPGEVDWQINVTGPTLPQWAILGHIPSVAGIPVETNDDDRTNLDPTGY